MLKERGWWALAGVWLAFFFRPLWLGESFFYRDIYLLFRPIKGLLVDMWQTGEPPLWNPFLLGGQPFWADISLTVFYPSTLLYFLLPLGRALALDVVLHVLASMTAAYLLARRLGLGQPAATLAGLIYGFCGVALSQINLFFRLFAMPYVPLMALCWHAYLKSGDDRGRRRWRWILALIVLGVVQLLAGASESVVFTWLTLLAFGFSQTSSVSALVPKLRTLILAGVAVVGLAAPQVLPLVEMVGQSGRGTGVGEETFTNWSLHPLRLPELVVPGFMGRTDTIEPGDYWGRQRVDSGFPFMLSLYFGAVVFALAFLAMAGRDRCVLTQRLVRSLSLLFALSLVLPLGRYLPLFDEVYRWLPGAQLFRYPVKFTTLGLLPVALLAADGLERLFRWTDSRLQTFLRVAWVVAGGLIVLLMLWGSLPAFVEGFQRVFFGQTEAKSFAGLRHAWIHVALIWLGATLVLQLHARQRLAWLPWVLVGLVAFDLTSAGRRINPLVPDARLDKVPQAAALVSERLDGGRFYRAPVQPPPLRAPSSDIFWFYRWNQEVLQGFLGASFGIPVIFHDDYNGLGPRRVMRMNWTLDAVPWQQKLPLLSAASVRVLAAEDEIHLPGVEKVARVSSSGGAFTLYENTRASRRLELIRAYRQVASEDDAMAAILAPGFDPRQHAVVEGEVPEADLTCRGGGRARILESSSRHQRIWVENECPSLLVLAEVFYPGWEVTIGGQPAEPLRANVAFSALWLEAGEHEIVRRYAPRSLYLGVLIFAITLTILVGVARHRWRHEAHL